jgi:hypothetical protein
MISVGVSNPLLPENDTENEKELLSLRAAVGHNSFEGEGLRLIVNGLVFVISPTSAITIALKKGLVLDHILVFMKEEVVENLLDRPNWNALKSTFATMKFWLRGNSYVCIHFVFGGG